MSICKSSAIRIFFVFTIAATFLLIRTSSAQTAKRGDIKIVEIMYNPPESGTDSLEYIEFYNNANTAFNLGGYTLAGVTLTIPNTVVIAPKGRIVFSVDSAKHRRFFGNHSIKWKSGSLSNSGEVIGIKTPSGVWIDSLKYSSAAPWPKEPNASGPSLVLCNEMADNKIAANWKPATEAVGIVNNKMVKGSPGAACYDPNAAKDTTAPRLLGLMVQSPVKIVLLFNEMVDAGAESLSSYSGISSIVSALRTPAYDSVIITLSQPLQRGKFYYLQLKNIKDIAGNTIQESREQIVFNDFTGKLVITEILFDNPGEDVYEFIELYNATTEEIPLGGLRLAPSVSTILPDLTIAPGNYFVIAKDSTKFREMFSLNAWQWNTGELNNSSDSIYIYNTSEKIIDSVKYVATTSTVGQSITLCNALHPKWDVSTKLTATDSAGNQFFATPGKACSENYLPAKPFRNDRSICGNIILNAGNIGAKYKWSNGDTSQNIMVDNPGKYSVLIVNGAGAINDSIKLTQLKAEAIFDTIICMNEVVQFTDNTAGAINRTWYFGEKDIAQSADTDYVFKTPGLVIIKLIVSDSFCSDTLTRQIFVKDCNSNVNTYPDQKKSIRVFPNPSTGEFNLQLKLSKPGNINISILDIQGRKVLEMNPENVSEFQKSFSLSGYKKGIYYIQIITGSEVITEKLIIQ